MWFFMCVAWCEFFFVIYEHKNLKTGKRYENVKKKTKSCIGKVKNGKNENEKERKGIGSMMFHTRPLYVGEKLDHSSG